MSLPWFRVYSEMVDDEKLRLLAFEDRWHYIALLCCKAKGILDAGGTQITRRKVAVKLGLDMPTLDEVLRRLAEVGLICPKTLQPKGWDKRQFESDVSTERVRKYRGNKGTGNVSPTFQKRNHEVSETPPDTDTDTDTDKELEKEPTVPPDFSPKSRPKRQPIPVQQIVDLYHEKLPMCPSVRKLTAARRASIEARWRSGDLPDLETWGLYFGDVAASKFLTGKTDPIPGRKRFVADLEWLSREGNYAKVFEGKYDK